MTIDKLTDQIRPWHNHIGILNDIHIVRILGVGEDEDDFFYICSRPFNRGGSVFHSSAVGWLYSLKEYIPAARYENMDRVAALNGAPPTAEFQVIRLSMEIEAKLLAEHRHALETLAAIFPDEAQYPYQREQEALIKVLTRAINVLGKEEAARWMVRKNSSLGDEMPISLLKTPEGVAKVMTALGLVGWCCY